MSNRVPLRLALRGSAAALALAAFMAPVAAAAQTATYRFDIPAQDLAQALRAFAAASREEVSFDPQLVTNRRSSAVTGEFTADAALSRLLADTGFTARRGQSGILLVTPTRSQDPAAYSAQIEDVVVTGTRIRGAETASPVITIDARQIDEEGFTDLGDVVRSIPQNFRGGQNPGVTLGPSSANVSNSNITGGSTLNLRGLGPDASLTLLNGRRLSYGGYAQGIDISAIPIEAVARLEIVPDGASAIYGSDAVAGVANVVLRRDFNGLTVGALYGDTSDGGLEKVEYTATAGATWDSGGLIATYLHSDQDPIFADQRRYTLEMDDPMTIYPSSELRSMLASVHHNFTSHITFSLDVIKTERNFEQFHGYDGFYYYSPYATKTNLIAPGVEFSLPGGWSASIGGASGDSETIYKLHLLRGATDALQSHGCYCNENQSVDIGFEGPLLYLGQRPVRLAAGGGWRTNKYVGESYISGSIQSGDQSARYVYGELAVPLVGKDNARSGLQRLELTAALRSEDYDTFGQVTTPKIGLVYEPNTTFSLKASWGESFKAPTLLQMYSRREIYLYRARNLGCSSCDPDSQVLMSYGGNQNLEPERADTWSGTISYRSNVIEGLKIDATYFSVDYNQRVLRAINNRAGALSDPVNAMFVTWNPTHERQRQLIEDFNDSFNAGSIVYDPGKTVAIVASEYVNVARQQVSGIDLSGRYSRYLGEGNLELRGSLSWIDLSQQTAETLPEFNLSGTIYNPAKVNWRAGGVYDRGGLTVSAFVNYTSGVTSKVGGVEYEGGSFTTFDTTLRYQVEPGQRFLSGVSFSLSANNLFNRAPPTFSPYPSGEGRLVRLSPSAILDS